MKIITVVGARPQFVKAAVVSRQFDSAGIQELIVHTGQHYDHQMSQVFFDELEIPTPAYNLRVGSGSHGAQTGQILEKIEAIFEDERPDVVLVYGDTNSTLAAAIAAAKLSIPVAHVEAGLRSYNRRMPEEVNRVLTDHASDFLFCPTSESVANLAAEGLRDNVHLVGDVMYDASEYYSRLAEERAPPRCLEKLSGRDFALMTCHRAENTDDPERLSGVVSAANLLAERLPLLFPVHPRTTAKLRQLEVEIHPEIRVIEPLSYLEILAVQKKAAIVLTDSGGMQKESFFAGTPCVTMRDETEWNETIETGANILAGADAKRILEASLAQLDRSAPLPDAASYYGKGLASEKIAGALVGLKVQETVPA